MKLLSLPSDFRRKSGGSELNGPKAIFFTNSKIEPKADFEIGDHFPCCELKLLSLTPTPGGVGGSEFNGPRNLISAILKNVNGAILKIGDNVPIYCK